jgi:hypothetical protein
MRKGWCLARLSFGCAVTREADTGSSSNACTCFGFLVNQNYFLFKLTWEMGKLPRLLLLLWLASTGIACGAGAQVGAGALRNGFVELTDETLDEHVLNGNPWVLVMFSPQCVPRS